MAPEHNTHRRRASDMSGNELQDELAQALAAVSDPEQKAVLLLMMRGFGQISDEIRSIRADIPGLREAVLNGHADVHHDDHEWIAKMKVVEEKRSAACDWCAHKKVQDELEESSRRRIRDGLVEKVSMAILMFLIGVLGATLFPHLGG